MDTVFDEDFTVACRISPSHRDAVTPGFIADYIAKRNGRPDVVCPWDFVQVRRLSPVIGEHLIRIRTSDEDQQKKSNNKFRKSTSNQTTTMIRQAVFVTLATSHPDVAEVGHRIVLIANDAILHEGVQSSEWSTSVIDAVVSWFLLMTVDSGTSVHLDEVVEKSHLEIRRLVGWRLFVDNSPQTTTLDSVSQDRLDSVDSQLYFILLKYAVDRIISDSGSDDDDEDNLTAFIWVQMWLRAFCRRQKNKGGTRTSNLSRQSLSDTISTTVVADAIRLNFHLVSSVTTTKSVVGGERDVVDVHRIHRQPCPPLIFDVVVLVSLTVLRHDDVNRHLRSIYVDSMTLLGTTYTDTKCGGGGWADSVAVEALRSPLPSTATSIKSAWIELVVEPMLDEITSLLGRHYDFEKRSNFRRIEPKTVEFIFEMVVQAVTFYANNDADVEVALLKLFVAFGRRMLKIFSVDNGEDGGGGGEWSKIRRFLNAFQ